MSNRRRKNQSNPGEKMPEDKKTDPSIQIWLATIPGLVTIAVAILGLTGTALTLLFNFPPFQRLFDPTSTATFTPISTPAPTETPTYTATITEIPIIEPSFTPTFTPLPTETFTPLPPTATNTATLPTSTESRGEMEVRLEANFISGKIPLQVKFSAKNSFFHDAAGNIFPCGACNFTWSVRQGSKYLYGPQRGGPSLDYTFGKRGTYIVYVQVCRNNSVTDCGGNATEITAE